MQCNITGILGVESGETLYLQRTSDTPVCKDGQLRGPLPLYAPVPNAVFFAYSMAMYMKISDFL
jgi:hypothetical protein